MTRLAFYLATALLALPACTVLAPSATLGSQEAACLSEADDTPAVKDMMTKAAGSEYYRLEHDGDLKSARQDATVACLQRRGMARRGGVERQKPLK